MARENTWVNNDGLRVGFGTRDTINQYDSQVHTYGRVLQAEIMVDASNIATFADATAPLSKDFEIPAQSVIVSSTLRVLESFDALTSIVVGLKDYDDGAANDPNGLHDTILLAALTDGDVDVGAGALIGTEVDEDQALSVTVTGSAATVGEFMVLVEYIEPRPSQASPAIIVGEI